MAKKKDKPQGVQAKDGIWEIYLTADAPIQSVSVPCIVKPEFARTRIGKRERRFNITISKTIKIKPLECTNKDCDFKWSPEQPLRPGKVMDLASRDASEEKWRKRHDESFDCKKCGARGQHIRGAGGDPLTFNQRPKFWLAADELRALKDALDPKREAEPIMDMITDHLGNKTEVIVGYRNRPIRARIMKKDRHGRGRAESVGVGQYVQLEPVSGQPTSIVDSEFVARLSENQTELMQVTDSLLALGDMLLKPELTGEERDELRTEYEELKARSAVLEKGVAPK